MKILHIFEILARLHKRTAVHASVSNGRGTDGAYANAALVVAYAALAHELQPLLTTVVQAVVNG